MTMMAQLDMRDVRATLIQRIRESETIPVGIAPDGERTYDGRALGLREALELVDVAVRSAEAGDAVEQRAAPAIIDDERA